MTTPTDAHAHDDIMEVGTIVDLTSDEPPQDHSMLEVREVFREIPRLTKIRINAIMAQTRERPQPYNVPTLPITQAFMAYSTGFVSKGIHPLKFLSPSPRQMLNPNDGLMSIIFREQPTRTIQHLLRQHMRPRHQVTMWRFVRRQIKITKLRNPQDKRFDHADDDPHKLTVLTDANTIENADRLYDQPLQLRNDIDNNDEPTAAQAMANCTKWIQHLRENLHTFSTLQATTQANLSTTATHLLQSPRGMRTAQPSRPRDISKARRAHYRKERETNQTITTNILFATVRRHPDLLLETNATTDTPNKAALDLTDED